MRYLLDTNILSDLIRNPKGAVRQRLDSVRNDQIMTSIIVAGELRYGVAKKRSVRLEGMVESMLDSVDVIPFEQPADRIYGDLRAQLEALGRPIGNNDLLVAAHALAIGCTLVTDNIREFSQVTSLAIENWLR